MMNGGRIDKLKLMASFGAAASRYDRYAALQREIGLTLLEHFPVQPEPGNILDLGAGTGFLCKKLVDNSGGKPLMALDIAHAMLTSARLKNPDLMANYLCADAESLPLRENSFHQIYSNLALQWCENLQRVFAECHRILQPGGRLVFSTFGPETLHELRTAWAAVDDYPHVNQFLEWRQIEGYAIEAGFADILCRHSRTQSEYADVMALMRELKGLGAHNVSPARNRASTTRQKLTRVIKNYPMDVGKATLATYEVFYVCLRK